jgi:adenylate kinase family enzyme
MHMRRVAVIGSGGSGKSVFARQLAGRLAVPVVHLDRLFWRPGWVETPEDEWRAAQREMVRAEAWVIEGNHASTLDVRLAAADTIVMLDLGRVLCLWRVVRRSISYRRRERPDRAPGCPERLNRDFLRWVWRFPVEGRDEALAAVAEFGPAATFHRLRTQRDVTAFLTNAGSAGPLA